MQSGFSLARPRTTMAAHIVGKLGQVAPGLAVLLGYRRKDLRFDIVAGLSVAAVALPIGIAYAEIARVPPVVGIYSAIFPLFAYALFGSSRQLITGPDAATCIMAAAAVGAIAGGDVQRHAVLMVALTLMTGLLYVVAGIARLGFIANFLSQPILTGYLHGIALIILIGQLPKLFGSSSGGAGFFPQVAAFAKGLGSTQPFTLALGAGLLLVQLALRRFLPRVPGALIVAALGVVAVTVFGLADRGVAVLGAVPAGFPPLQLPAPRLAELPYLLRDAAGITLISFTSGVLTSKSFARRSGDDVNANQELIGFGACNLASGLAHGFPVTGADSRTAVNAASGGRTQLAGVVAGATMLAFLLLLTEFLAHLPKAALAAIIIVSTLGFFDTAALRDLWKASRREMLFCLATTAGVLIYGVLPGVLLAVGLSLLWVLAASSRPHDAILGRAPGIEGLHDIRDYPAASTIPGLLIYRFDANLLFFNCDRFRDRVRRHIRDAATPVEWVLIDATPIDMIDYTSLHKLRELHLELAAKRIVLAFAGAKHNLARFFRSEWIKEHEERALLFPGFDSALRAFERRTRAP